MRAAKYLLSFTLACGSMFAADLTDQYKSVADRLIDAALADNDGYQKLAYLCDRIGARLSGMPSLDRAIENIFMRNCRWDRLRGLFWTPICSTKTARVGLYAASEKRRDGRRHVQ
jgi:hypothetical protein